jgi:hypothetical protein
MADERLTNFHQCLVSGTISACDAVEVPMCLLQICQSTDVLWECSSPRVVFNDMCTGRHQVASGTPSCTAQHQGALRLCPCVPRSEQTGAATGTLLAGNNAAMIQPKDDQLQLGLVAA